MAEQDVAARPERRPPAPWGHYWGDDGLLYRTCDGTCDTCPEWCWQGKPVGSVYDPTESDDDA